ncbi:hypothetical protein C8A03DRAFT_39178, partial [Achaetomium macrosporum]
MGVLLFKHPLNAAFTIDLVTSWQSEEEQELLFPPPATLFGNLSYDAIDQYADGVTGVVGSWSGNRILGGVKVFDRSEAWDGERTPEPNAYLHSDRDGLAVGNCPYPLSVSEKNLTRYDPEVAAENKVYRDIWGRKAQEN